MRPPVDLHRPGCYVASPARHEPELQRHAQFAAHGLSDEGEPYRARAGAAQGLGGSATVRANPKITTGSTIVRSARRSAICQRRRSHGHCAQQNLKGFRSEIANHARQTGAVRAGLGLPRVADRIQGRKGITRPFTARSAPEIGSVRAQICRHPARAIQTPRRAGRLGASLSDARSKIRSGNPARVRGLRRKRSRLSIEETGLLEHRRADRAGRSRSGISGTRRHCRLREISDHER